jgi:ABC-type transport system substrate-binding protein
MEGEKQMERDRIRHGWARIRIGRRRLLRASATGAVGIASLGALVRCSPSATAPAGGSPTVAAAPTVAATQPGAAAAASPAAPSPKYGGTLHLPIVGEVPNLDPHQVNGPLMITGGISVAWSRLVKIDAGPNRKGDSVLLAGDLAESWTQPDETTYLFKLRPGVKWQNVAPVNGRALVAEDVRYSFQRILDLKVNASFLGGVQKVEAVDPQTVKLTIAKPDADFLTTLTNFTNVVVAQEAVDLKGDLKEGPVVGTGPWILQDWKSQQIAVGKRNPDYFLKGLPYMDGYDVQRLGDQQAGLTAFRAKQIDETPSAGLTLKDIDGLKAAIPDLQVTRTRNRLNWLEIGFNTSAAPTSDIRVRQAFQLAIDRAAAFDAVFEGLGYYPVPFILPGLDWIVPEDELKTKWYNRDLAAAKRLLGEAGFPNGLDVEMLYMVYSTQLTSSAELLAAQLKDAGIRATLKPTELSNFLQTVRTGKADYQVFYGYNIAAATTNAYLTSNLHSQGSQNGTKIRDPKLDEMIEKQAVLRDEAARKAALLDLQRYLLQQVPTTAVWGTESPGARQAAVQNRRTNGQPFTEADILTYTWLNR